MLHAIDRAGRTAGRLLSRRQLLRYTQATLPGYDASWHHREIAQALDRVRQTVAWKRGKGPEPARPCLRLAVMVPPQNGKSELISRRWPAHLLGNDPSLKIIAASYNKDLAAGHALEVRRQFGSQYFRRLFPGVAIADRTAALDETGRNTGVYFEIPKHRGYFRAGGIMGGLTGWGFDVGILDDPIKNQEEADSDAYREKLKAEWHASFESRERGPHAAIVMVFTRWRFDDLMGYVLEHAQKHGSTPWEVLRFPALLDEAPSPLDPRERGEALWPSRFPVSYLEDKQRRTPPAQWDALYQQRPAPEQGGMFDPRWWRYYDGDDLPSMWDQQFLAVDAAFKGETPSQGGGRRRATGRSWVVLQCWGRRDANLYLLDQVRAHLDFAQTKDALRELASRWPDAYVKLIEDAANGPALISDLQDELGGMTPVPASESKITRASFGLPVIRAGNVKIPRGAEWIEGFVHEHKVFPHGSADDQVDATAHAIRYHREGGSGLDGLTEW